MTSNKVLIFDPSYGTLNLGDNIIVESTLKQLDEILTNKFRIRVGTHAPLYHFHQVYGNNIYAKQIKEVDNMFILGSNLLFKDVLLTRKRPWNIHFLSSRGISDVVLVGIGSNGNKKRNTLYTRLLYKKVLSNKYIHSVRDEETCNYVKSLGLKAVNTGCATMWDLTPEHCAEIPTNKSNNAILTLTDYAQDTEMDEFLINTIVNEYENTYFWPQGSEDFNYFSSLNIDHSKIIVLNPSLEDYSRVLSSGDIDYIGSRLHGGIFALQHKVRTIIVAVDHRALNKKIDYNLQVIERTNSRNELLELINSDFETKITLDFELIKEWKNQFVNQVTK